MAMQETEAGFTGLFGHTFDAGKINRQFHVQRKVGDGKYLVQIFSWFTGEPIICEVWSDETLSDPTNRFYPNKEAWIGAADAHI